MTETSETESADAVEFLRLIKQLEFKSAWTMPLTPHQHSARKPSNVAVYQAASALIKRNAKRERFRDRVYRVWYVGEYRYWLIGRLQLINRAKALWYNADFTRSEATGLDPDYLRALGPGRRTRTREAKPDRQLSLPLR